MSGVDYECKNIMKRAESHESHDAMMDIVLDVVVQGRDAVMSIVYSRIWKVVQEQIITCMTFMPGIADSSTMDVRTLGRDGMRFTELFAFGFSCNSVS